MTVNVEDMRSTKENILIFLDLSFRWKCDSCANWSTSSCKSIWPLATSISIARVSVMLLKTKSQLKISSRGEDSVYENSGSFSGLTQGTF